MDNPLQFPPCRCPNPHCPERASVEPDEHSKPADPGEDSPVLTTLRERVREDNARRATGRGGGMNKLRPYAVALGMAVAYAVCVSLLIALAQNGT